MDVHTPEQRRYNMSQIRSKNTKPEQKLMKALKDKKIWFTKHRNDVFGKPDVVFKRKKVAVFVDSDFWHGKKHLPKSNQEFWIAKFERNRQRDNEVNITLSGQGWTVIRLSDEDVKKDIEGCLKKIFMAIGLNDTVFSESPTPN
jgi:DNA mismatch endonuclease (patch repair protein)